ncbi:unnamed protein product [Sphenostylis stenocarpa]|uniref:Uncharacterized protein n=1 Tax=Sphenostylis stenocarpa TaxID=92480 RepID=A0AA86RY63_9FABA|nr:unnamed protein product [Sphenostylis stenocarpa]
MKSDCIPAAITSFPMSDFPILRVVITRVITGDAELDIRAERETMNAIPCCCVKKWINEVIRRDITKVLNIAA